DGLWRTRTPRSSNWRGLSDQKNPHSGRRNRNGAVASGGRPRGGEMSCLVVGAVQQIGGQHGESDRECENEDHEGGKRHKSRVLVRGNRQMSARPDHTGRDYGEERERELLERRR